MCLESRKRIKYDLQYSFFRATIEHRRRRKLHEKSLLSRHDETWNSISTSIRKRRAKRIYTTLLSWEICCLQILEYFTAIPMQRYYQNLISQVTDLKKEIEDNQALIIALESVDLFRQYKEMSTKEIMESIKSVFQEAGSDLDEATVKSAYQNAIQLAAMPPIRNCPVRSLLVHA